MTKRTSYALATNGQDAPQAVSTSASAITGRGSWSERAGVRLSSRTSTVPATGGIWTSTGTDTAGVTTVTEYASGVTQSTEVRASDDTVVARTDYAYDPLFRNNGSTDSRTGPSSSTLRENGAMATSTSNNGADTTIYGHDSMGRVIQTTLPDASVKHARYSHRDQVTARWGALDYPTSYGYNERGAMTSLTTYRANTTGAEPLPEDVGDTTVWEYQDLRGWLERKLYADGKGTNYTYKPSGRLETRTQARVDAAGAPVVTTYGYDANGQQNLVDYSSPGTSDVLYAYTRDGRVDTVTDVLGTRQYGYDPSTLLPESETIPAPGGQSYTVTQGRDALLRSDGVTLQDDNAASILHSVGYGYDAANRLSTVASGADTFTYGYQPDTYGLIKTVTGPALITTNTYEPHRNVLVSKANTVGGSNLSTHSYVTNNIGQRTSVDRTGSAFAASDR